MSTGLCQCIAVRCARRSDKFPAASTALSCTTGDWLRQKGPHYSDSLPASLASRTIQTRVQGPGLHFQSTEWNGTSVPQRTTSKEQASEAGSFGVWLYFARALDMDRNISKGILPFISLWNDLHEQTEFVSTQNGFCVILKARLFRALPRTVHLSFDVNYIIE